MFYAVLLVLIIAGTLYIALRTDLPWKGARLLILLGVRLGLLALVAAFMLDVRLPGNYPTHKVELMVAVDRSASISEEGNKLADKAVLDARQEAAKENLPCQVFEFGKEERGVSDITETLNTAANNFKGSGEKRILLVSDGLFTAADPISLVPKFQKESVKVYTLPLPRVKNEGTVTGIITPPVSWQNLPTPVEVGLRCTEPTLCELSLFADGEEINSKKVRLSPGLTSASLPVSFSKTGMHRVEARAKFDPDKYNWNNTASAFIYTPLAPRILIISRIPPSQHPLKATLEANKMTVKVLAPDSLPGQFACDCVVLDNVPAKAFKAGQLDALEKYVSDGGSILFTGGVNSYGAGGYLGTPLEPVFPVLLRPKKEYPPFAVGIVFDNSWSMNEGVSAAVGKIDIAKEIAIAAVENLGKKDMLALVSFDSDYHNIIPLTKVSDLDPLKYEIARLGALGMTNIYGALSESLRILKDADVAYKHLVIISDGKETESPDYSLILSSIEKNNMTLSAVAVGLNANDKLLNTLAYAGKGRFYHVKTVKEIPSIVVQDAKNFQDKLIVESALSANKKDEDPALLGLDISAMPKLSGYNRTGTRQHAWTPLTISNKQEPLLARMRYGRGQAAAFMSSVSSAWISNWIEQDSAGFEKFWVQLTASDLLPPYQLINPEMKFAEGYPVFTIIESQPDQKIYRRVDGKTEAADIKAGPAVLTDLKKCDAALFISAGKATRVFSWTKSFAAEFDAPEKGMETLKNLSEYTGGVFKPEAGKLCAGGKAVTHFEVDPVLWLVLALILFAAEIFVRRSTAFADFLRKRAFKGKKAALILIVVFTAALLVKPAELKAMQVEYAGSKVIVTGNNFRYTWDTARGGELSCVEQRGLSALGWWDRGFPKLRRTPWQRINSTFAWKSLDTIPALSVSTSRMAYYSGEWGIAYASADRNAKLKVIKEAADELIFETECRPRIYENRMQEVPWIARQRVRVFDSGLIITAITLELPANETYALDWASMSVNLDDMLYKEPNPNRTKQFSFGYAFPDENQYYKMDQWKTVLQGYKHVPLDIDMKRDAKPIITDKPLLFVAASYDLTHLPGAPAASFTEFALEKALSITGTKTDFGSFALIRPNSGMSPVPTWEGSMRGDPCFSAAWNLYEGEAKGFNESEAFIYKNTLSFLAGSRKRSSRPDAPADDRNVLIGARVYFAKDRLPAVTDIAAMSAEGCNVLILGAGWRSQMLAKLVEAAHAAGMRVGVAIDIKDLKEMAGDDSWFKQYLKQDQDGIFVNGVNFFSNKLPQGEFTVLGEKVSFKYDGADLVNAAPFALCMKALRKMVGPRGFLIGDPGDFPPTELAFAEFDLCAFKDLTKYPRYSSKRYPVGAGLAPVTDTLSGSIGACGAMYADTPIILWPAAGKGHLNWWNLCKNIPSSGASTEQDFVPSDRRFSISSSEVHGTLYKTGNGTYLLLVGAAAPDGAYVNIDTGGDSLSVRTLDDEPVACKNGTFNAGSFVPSQVKGFRISVSKK